MYEPISGGHTITIGYDKTQYEVNIPPVGYVHNRFENRLEKRPIINEDKPKKDQKWERTPLPKDWNKRRKQELKRRKNNPDHFDEENQKFIDQEWDRRVNGVWVMIHGEPYYFTGLYYFYLNWWKMDFGYADFRYPDLENFYFIDYCMEDPYCYGMNIFGGRRTGKTAKMGVFLYNVPSMLPDRNAGLQSKNYTDARRVFEKSIILPWRRLPDFFQPYYNFDSKQTKSLDFKIPPKRGKKDIDDIDMEEGLNSKINYEDAGVVEYDGTKLYCYGMDEIGKPENVDVYQRWLNHKPCLFVPGYGIIGCAMATTTIEDMAGTDKFLNLLDDSFLDNRKTNGETVSGLYNYFIPADRTYYFDEYGFPLVEESRERIVQDREGIDDMATLMGLIRKYPLSIEEARSISRQGNPFNQKKLNEAENHLHTLPEKPYRIGNFYWIEKDRKVGFEDDNLNGRVMISHVPGEKERNNVLFTNDADQPLQPDNLVQYVIGVDPTSEGDTTTSKRKSSFAMVAFRGIDPTNDTENSETFVMDYMYKPDNPEEAYEDVVMACVFFGCRAHIETQKIEVGNYMIRRGYKNFILSRPKNTLAPNEQNSKQKLHSLGTPASKEIVNQYVNLLKKHIAEHGERLKLPRLIDQFQKFTPDMRTFYDLVVAAGYAKIGSEAPYDPKPDYSVFRNMITRFN